MADFKSEEEVTLLKLSEGNECIIHHFGATVISWVCEGSEVLFVSSKAVFDEKKAIRGGIPVVFPCFGPWSLGPQHGFARITKWKPTVVEEEIATNAKRATFTLEDSEDTRKMWNYKFQLVYKVTLSDHSMTTELIVNNTDDKSFDFTCLLHTYFLVPDISRVRIEGLSGLAYVDKARKDETFKEDREYVEIPEFYDRAYVNTPTQQTIANVSGNRRIVMTKSNLPDTVVWNPWRERAAGMSDFSTEEFEKMVCVEAGRVAEPYVLPAGQSATFKQTLQVLPAART